MPALLRFAFSLSFVLAGSAAASEPLMQVAHSGGTLSDAVSVGHFLYVPAGNAIETWNIADPSHPVSTGRSPDDVSSPGLITDVTAIAGHLYAPWFALDGSHGVSIYALDDPAHPVRAGEIESARVERAVSDGEHLYLAGAELGVAVFDVSDPLHPRPIGTADPSFGFAYTAAVRDGRLLVGSIGASGNFLSMLVDVADPAEPRATPLVEQAPFDWLLGDGGYAFALGAGFQVYDVSDPAHAGVVASASDDLVAARGLIVGHSLYLFGTYAMPIWNIASPTAPVWVRDAAVDTLSVVAVTMTSAGAFELDADGRGTLFDVSNETHPEPIARTDARGSASALGGAMTARHAYIADSAFGLRVASLTLDPIANVAIGLDDPPAAPGALDVALEGDLAYVTGYDALHAIDVSDPAHPVEIGHLRTPWLQDIVVSGNRAYATAPPDFSIHVYDLTDPEEMRELGAIAIDNPVDIALRGDRLYAASAGGFDSGGGLRIVDVSDSAHPVEIGVYPACGPAAGDSIALLPGDGATLALGCSDGMLHLIDASDAAAPVTLGTYAFDAFDAVQALAASGDTVYAGHTSGVDAIDVSRRDSPQWSAHYGTVQDVASLRIAPTGALLAMTRFGGAYVFASAVPLPARGHSAHPRREHAAIEP